jgi:hypothetical protein
MKIVLSFLLIFIAILIVLNILFINRIPNNFEILQANNPDKDTLEKMIIQKYPSIFTDVTKNLDLEKLNHNITINQQKESDKQISEYFSYYLTPMCLTYKFSIHRNDLINLTMVSSHRLLICQLQGKSKLYLFTPIQKKYLYSYKKNGIYQSKINFWQPDKSLELFNKTKYVEINLYEGQMIYIPYKWWYCIDSGKNANHRVLCSSESFFSYFLRM